jgi:hypothetical protein
VLRKIDSNNPNDVNDKRFIEDTMASSIFSVGKEKFGYALTNLQIIENSALDDRYKLEFY